MQGYHQSRLFLGSQETVYSLSFRTRPLHLPPSPTTTGSHKPPFWKSPGLLGDYVCLVKQCSVDDEVASSPFYGETRQRYSVYWTGLTYDPKQHSNQCGHGIRVLKWMIYPSSSPKNAHWKTHTESRVWEENKSKSAQPLFESAALCWCSHLWLYPCILPTLSAQVISIDTCIVALANNSWGRLDVQSV